LFLCKVYFHIFECFLISVILISVIKDVFDLRLSPSINLLKSLKKYTNNVFLYDPFIEKNDKLNTINKLPKLKKFDVVIFVNAHKQLKNISFNKFVKNTIYFDLNNVLSDKIIKKCKKNNILLKVLGDKK